MVVFYIGTLNITITCLICYNNNLDHNRADDKGVNWSVFPATDWLTSDQSLFIIRHASNHVQNVLVTFRLQTWQPPNNNRSHSDLSVLKTCVRLNLWLIIDEPLIGVWCFLYPTDQIPWRLVVGGSAASHGSVLGPWPVSNRNQREVLGAIGG